MIILDSVTEELTSKRRSTSWRKRLRVLRAALTQHWHQHHCRCGENWYCCGRHNVAPIVDVCETCEEREQQQWAASYQQRIQQERADVLIGRIANMSRAARNNAHISYHG